ncbi:interferon-inducible GTPase 5-like [Macrotis lagotis]|uniref:interferon-inducible GTPase 5-like n=1 Tax=Macrotis lagotis TaxID=92651 RepID=UPI003D69AA90
MPIPSLPALTGRCPHPTPSPRNQPISIQISLQWTLATGSGQGANKVYRGIWGTRILEEEAEGPGSKEDPVKCHHLPELSLLMASQGRRTTQESQDILILTPEEIVAFSEAFQEDSLTVIANKLRTTLHTLENIRLDFAILGEKGSGKSTFVNAIRGLGDEDQGSSRTGLVENTLNPVPYPHPKYPNILIWELPNITSHLFQADEYLEQVRYNRYDFFIIIASENFTTTHVQLAAALQRHKKHVYFVRSKIDVDIDASRRRRPITFSETKVLLEIQENCCNYLKAEGVAQPQVFLLSMFDLGKFDFHLLIETIVRELKSNKRYAFLVALPNVSLPILEKKAYSLLQHVWLVTTVACTINPQPVPGVPNVACNLGFLVHTLSSYRRSLGQESTLLNRLIKRAAGSPQITRREVTERLVIDLLGQANIETTRTFALRLACLPVLGILASCSLSFATVYQMLRKYLDRSAKDTLNQLTGS